MNQDPSDKSVQSAARLLQGTVELIEHAVVILDASGHALAANEASRRLLGTPRLPCEDETPWSITDAWSITDTAGRAVPDAQLPLTRALRGEAVEPTELTLRFDSGRAVDVRCRVQPLRDESARVIAVVATFEDLTDQRGAQARQETAQQRYRALTELVSDYTYELEVEDDGALKVGWVTDSFKAFTGYSIAELKVAGGLRQLVLPADHGVLRRQFKAVMAGHEFSAKLRIRTRDDEVRWLRSFAKPIFDPEEGRVVRVLGAAQDISDEKLLSPLTGLPSNAAFRDRLEVALSRLGRRPGQILAAVYLDFDHFHVVNHSLGYAAGDTLLRAYADRLRALTRPGDSVAHLRGDEYALLLTDLRYPDDAIQFIEEVLEELAVPVEVDDTVVVVTASAGVAFAEEPDVDPTELVRCAQTAVNRARALGGARVEVFDPEMMTAAQERLSLESALRQAVNNDALTVHYQPIVDLQTGALCGFEALARWTDPDHGAVSPGTFIAMAEDTGLIVQLGEAVLGEACGRLARWNLANPDLPPLTISVNLSPLQVMRGDLLFRLDRILRRTGLAPNRLRLEITESTLMRDRDGAIALLQQVRARGVRVSVDDFGTGHSSLSLLHRFPVDVLKVDRAFVKELGEDPHSHSIVGTIVALASHFELELIAEGIETETQRDALRALGVRKGQGFLFSKALSAEAADALVASVAPKS